MSINWFNCNVYYAQKPNNLNYSEMWLLLKGWTLKGGGYIFEFLELGLLVDGKTTLRSLHYYKIIGAKGVISLDFF